MTTASVSASLLFVELVRRLAGAAAVAFVCFENNNIRAEREEFVS